MLLLPAVSMAQAAPADETPVFRSTSLALVRFQVVRKKQYVVDLQAADIELLEDGKLNSMAADSFQLEVATPERLLVQEQAKEAQIPAEGGMLGVLPEHAALLSLLGTGQLSYTLLGGEKRTMVISGGYLQILDNHVRVLADRAEMASEIDVARAQKSLERARERMAAPASAGVDVSRALNAMKRAEAWLAAAKSSK